MKIKESNRLINLCEYEDNLYLQGYELIAGVDEAGRGALAGPIVAAAVILKRKNIFIEGIKDSKKINYKKRKDLFKIIIDSCICYSIAKVCSKKIDEISLGRANIFVFEKAIENLKFTPQVVITDALQINSKIPVLPIINGDELSISIAAASIIAKVTRDEIMEKFGEIYPNYGFIENKGYGTKNHFKSIEKYGPCPIHRLSFKGVLNKQNNIF
ncbi:MAG: ribonuclease HII [Actinobacteria bacterium]|nr:ribonuclease HII [Actinomycetota bacterium]